MGSCGYSADLQVEATGSPITGPKSGAWACGRNSSICRLSRLTLSARWSWQHAGIEQRSEWGEALLRFVAWPLAWTSFGGSHERYGFDKHAIACDVTWVVAVVEAE